jgi:hypothetical protein
MWLAKVEKDRIGVHAAIITNSLILSTIPTSPMFSDFSSHTPTHEDCGGHVGDQWSLSLRV